MKPYHRNPRQITKKKLDKLNDTMSRLGDISGIVHNLRTDEIIGGHQRKTVFGEATEIQIIEKYDKPDKQGTVAQGMRVWSLCEHHLLPFWCDISIGYIARDRVLGLSKFARIAHKHAHKLQIQERLVDDIAKEVGQITGSVDVAVLAQGVHSCMVMRGIKTDGVMVSSVTHGIFRESPAARQEFLSLVQ